nr:HC-Pro [Donkey orchid virus A]
SNVDQIFWRGFNRSFLKYKRPVTDHNCASTFSVEKCGSIAAIVCQMLLPCGRITCQECAENYRKLSQTERIQRLKEHVQEYFDIIRKDFAEFIHVESFLESLLYLIDEGKKTGFYDQYKETMFKLCAPSDHICDEIQRVEGADLAALIVQTVAPCTTLGCTKCSKRLQDLSTAELDEFLSICRQKNLLLREKILFGHDGIKKALDWCSKSTAQVGDTTANLEVVRICQNHEAKQMQDIKIINETLLRGQRATLAESENAAKALLSVTQWFKNHYSAIQANDLKSFRNKISQKLLINPSLICDNQLDVNGNFVWGQRGYQSLQIFRDYYDTVVSGSGYLQYENRTFPNGSRKLAIRNLIVPMDIERLREHFVGESIEKVPLTEECVSRMNRGFVHACCCVTDDRGEPFYSQVKPPTKRHMVIGGAGDDKYVDMPDLGDIHMYIVKDGYCYLNVFLAMLINVNESEAREFVKMVKNVVIPKLGKWPKLTDLAVMCYAISAAFPETKTAELPRILVDHKNKMMHVIDSYGSLTVGYHILKAATVTHLISFAADQLDSAMKEYRVG